ncbi:hypothetical protein V6N13_068297 [Hibiscus sabdariffa]|uniref:Uncharacterized protein n=1 Tax=Hibiscus sabdariffa TaxID=183260 RepID=A0ABR2QM73_9ROSI
MDMQPRAKLVWHRHWTHDCHHPAQMKKNHYHHPSQMGENHCDGGTRDGWPGATDDNTGTMEENWGGDANDEL